MSQQIIINLGDGLKIKRTIKTVSVSCEDELFLDKEITDDNGNVSTEEILKEKNQRNYRYDSTYLSKLPEGFIPQAFALLTAE